VFLLHAIMTATFVALPFLLQRDLELPLAGHWKIYIGSLLISLAGTVPLIVADDRRGKSATFTIAISLIALGQGMLAFAGASTALVVLALAVFFGGFNFLEAGLPARLSILAAGDLRGTSLGVFSSAQFLGIFTGGIAGGRLLAGGDPSVVFLVCGLAATGWLVLHRFADGN